MPKIDPVASHQLGRRGFLVSAATVGSMALLGTRLVYLQGLDPTGRAALSLAERQRTVTIPALRGEILDVNGHVLARTVQRYNITVDQTAVQDFERSVTLADGSPGKETVTAVQALYDLADILEMSDSDVKDALDGNSHYYIVKDNVTPDVYNRISRLNIPFIYGEVISDRLYPDGSVGGSVVGRYSMIEEPVEGSDETQMVNYSVGIERVFEEQLRGSDGSRTYEIGADGIRIPVGEERVQQSVNGQSVRLTINQDIQYFAQQVIKARVEALDAEWGSAVVMNVRDGSLIALADSSMMDPGAEIHDQADMIPRAISQAVEPGSTEKLLTSAAVIEQGIADPLTIFNVPAELEIDGQIITDAFVHGPEKRTFNGIIADSMNTGTVLAGSQLTPEQRHDWLKKFGMGEYTGVELTGESQGLVADWQEWDIRQQYTVLFGQGVAQTPLQTCMIFQALGNQGVRLKPRIVDAIINPDGTETVPEVEEGLRVVSPETAAECLTLMENVVEHSVTGDAKVAGYRVGGKTGTAEAPAKDKPGYDGYTTSFIGLAPIEDPQYLVGITLQRPQGAVTSIGASAQFSQLMEKVLHTYNVPHSTTEPNLLPKFEEDQEKDA
ncbi:penicillin-binding protein 2 [Rothia sp. ZJ1223]|uniref:peptidoglycan D,D-transpeptidase FtsI family protein n=1 Tax=Rothia sp. ZJ1223 TaxID=2811098 RepID=UPI001EF4BB75|nr:penicillin-binding protein 2 [Rothia sp. ZJ1223]